MSGLIVSTGAWYRGDEIGRRGGFFYVGLTLGTLTAGLIQAGASSNLDGVQGHAGWRWMYIICGIITIPVGVLGYFVIPGTPEMPNRLVLKQEDLDLAERRLKRAGHATKGKFTWGTLGQVARTRKVWLLLVLDVLFWNASINTSSGGFLLWLKSLGRYKASRVNELGAIAPALGIFYTLFICFASDLVLGPAWAIITAHIWNSIGLIILVVWNVPEPAKWFGFITTYSAVAMSSVLYGWVNSELAFSPAARAFTLVLLNTISQSTTAWTPLLAFKTVEGPRFTKGYSYVLGSAIALMATAYALKIIFARQAYPKPVDEEESGGSGTQTPAEVHELPKSTV